MFALWAVLIPIIDQVSKALVVRNLPIHETIALIPGLLQLTHVRNPGAAFGILPYQRSLFVVIAGLLLVASFLYRRRIKDETFLVQLGLGLGLGGAIGNLIDRLRTGYVTDFFEVPAVPIFGIFNVADAAIVIGVAILLWSTLFRKDATAPPVAEGGDGAGEG